MPGAPIKLDNFYATYRNSYPKALSGLSVEHVIRPFAALPVHSGNDRRHTLTVSKSCEKKYKQIKNNKNKKFSHISLSQKRRRVA
jgi:hypothetical protein